MNPSPVNLETSPPESQPTVSVSWQRCFEGVLLGTAVGDALGLPAENLSPERIRRLWHNEWRMRFLLRRGMISDDTEHTLMVTQALLAQPDNPARFQITLAWKFRWWLAGLPAGVGLATARAVLRLWFGVPANRSAVASGGSGPAMRSAIIGAFFADQREKRREFVLASARLTHRGWQAETAALAVAEAVSLAAARNGCLPEASELLSALRSLSREAEWQQRLSQLESALRAQDSVPGFVDRLGLKHGVTGYSLNVVPVALYAWLRHRGDFPSALTAALECGGDTDTVGAIVGALCGAVGGVENIPPEWLDGLFEWPRSTAFMRHLTERLAEQKQSGRPLGEVRCFWPGVIPRNLLFLVIVILHGFRRLLPPY
jgi:ADP-ribosylglycohydrolase